MTAAEIPLFGGTANRGQVYRVGETVRRPLRPSAPGVHALLRHLEDVGFDGAPRVLGVDAEGREVLTYNVSRCSKAARSRVAQRTPHSQIP